MKSKVFSYAWTIYRAGAETFSAALRKAWRIYRLLKAMKAGVVSFTYRKKNGERRAAKGMFPSNPELKGGRAFNASAVTYFDLDANGWRSFCPQNLIIG